MKSGEKKYRTNRSWPFFFVHENAFQRNVEKRKELTNGNVDDGRWCRCCGCGKCLENIFQTFFFSSVSQFDVTCLWIRNGLVFFSQHWLRFSHDLEQCDRPGQYQNTHKHEEKDVERRKKRTGHRCRNKSTRYEQIEQFDGVRIPHQDTPATSCTHKKKSRHSSQWKEAIARQKVKTTKLLHESNTMKDRVANEEKKKRTRTVHAEGIGNWINVLLFELFIFSVPSLECIQVSLVFVLSLCLAYSALVRRISFLTNSLVTQRLERHPVCSAVHPPKRVCFVFFLSRV